ncbi:MAG TPA: gluconate 2-dehydrogenase subunit 3 family protein, partial [Verrucomicrobiae bacterium]|nr:gluconate 2-dehydrogenase subunit 3 family protein [Verrucomicrobiae bacterium]
MNFDETKRMDRREALKWVATALAALPVMEWKSLGAEELKRTLTDPDLLHPGKLWDRTLTKAELRTVAALCDVIIPADEKSRSA